MELLAIQEGMTMLNQEEHQNKHYTIFSNCQIPLQRYQNDERGPGQAIP
jgi:hypothetical protein